MPIAPFELAWRGIGTFPSPKHPRALWLGVINGAAPLARVEAEVSRRLAGVNAVELDDRAFLPHLTLGRVKMAGAGVDWPKILQAVEVQARDLDRRSRHALPQPIVAAGAALYWSGQRSADRDDRTMIPAILIGYAVGSLPIGYLVAQGARGIDLRRVGSGNVGAANVYRTAGLSTAIAVMLADMAKGAAAVLLAGGGANAVAAGVAAVIGHIYPVWLRFQGRQGRGHRQRRVRRADANPDAHRRGGVCGRRRAHAFRLARVDRRDDRAADRRVADAGPARRGHRRHASSRS